jgi:transposase InsO family protein
VSEKTVADSMRRQGLIARKIRRRGGLTRQDKTAPKFPDLLGRDFTASAPNARWVTDMVRHEAPWIRVEVRDLHRRVVAAARLELRAV